MDSSIIAQGRSSAILSDRDGYGPRDVTLGTVMSKWYFRIRVYFYAPGYDKAGQYILVSV